jgi:hypothetical protein
VCQPGSAPAGSRERPLGKIQGLFRAPEPKRLSLSYNANLLKLVWFAVELKLAYGLARPPGLSISLI